MNFADVYTLCHKEGHARSGLFGLACFMASCQPRLPMGTPFNHHRYNNGPLDIITTSDKPRDNFANWRPYLPRYFLYSVNISAILQFSRENNSKVVYNVFGGTLYFFAWLAICSMVID
jgi:hypothetical protein